MTGRVVLSFTAAVALAVFLHLAVPAASIAGLPLTVLTSLEVTQALGEALAAGTSIRVENVLPAGHFMRAQDAYLKKHRVEFFRAAEKAGAVLTVGAAWAHDPLYKWGRRGNIRIVNIDAAKPLDEYGAGVALTEIEGRYSPFVWRSPANLTRMAAIVAADLIRLSPENTEAVNANLKTLQAVLFRLRSKYEAALLDVDIADLAAFTDGYTYLAEEFGLDVHFYMLMPERELTEDSVRTIGAQLRRDGVKAVLCAWEPGPLGLQAIKEGGAVPVVLDRFERKGEADPVKALVDWYDGNLSRILAGLKN